MRREQVGVSWRNENRAGGTGREQVGNGGAEMGREQWGGGGMGEREGGGIPQVHGVRAAMHWNDIKLICLAHLKNIFKIFQKNMFKKIIVSILV